MEKKTKLKRNKYFVGYKKLKNVKMFEEFSSLTESASGIPSAQELKKMFDDINKELKGKGDTESVVPLTDVEYYTEQIANIFDADENAAKKAAEGMAKLSENLEVTSKIPPAQELKKMFDKINKIYTSLDIEEVPFTDVDHYTMHIALIYSANVDDAERAAKELSKLSENYEIDSDADDFAMEHAKAVLDSAFEAHKMSGKFDLKKAFEDIAGDIPKFNDIRFMIYDSLLTLLDDVTKQANQLK